MGIDNEIEATQKKLNRLIEQRERLVLLDRRGVAQYIHDTCCNQPDDRCELKEKHYTLADKLIALAKDNFMAQGRGIIAAVEIINDALRFYRDNQE